MPYTVQIDQLVIDEGEAAIEAEAPHPRAPLPHLPPVPGTTFHCNINEALGLHTTVSTCAQGSTYDCPAHLFALYMLGRIKQLVALARAGS